MRDSSVLDHSNQVYQVIVRILIKIDKVVVTVVIDSVSPM